MFLCELKLKVRGCRRRKRFQRLLSVNCLKEEKQAEIKTKKKQEGNKRKETKDNGMKNKKQKNEGEDE